MTEALDLTGQQFGSLTALEPRRSNEFNSNGKHRTAWLCRCVCGKEIVVDTAKLRKGIKTSCGCQTLRKNGEQRKAIEHHGDAKKQNGRSKGRIYSIWCCMMNRTGHHAGSIEKAKRDYQDRGIDICDEWKKSYVAFREWALSHGYRDDLSIDRIDNDGSYCPDNCRWATAIEQRHNQGHANRAAVA